MTQRLLSALRTSSMIFFALYLNTTAQGAAVFKSKEGKFDFHIEKVTDQAVEDNASLQFPKNKIFSISLRLIPLKLNPSGKSTIAFDATMPAHKHGMLTKPRVTSQDNDRFLIEGIKFHMPGSWVLHFTVKQGDVTDVLTMPWDVK